MNIFRRLVPIIVTALFVGGLGLTVWEFFSRAGDDDTRASLVIPTLTDVGESGKKIFDANCAKCHGENGTGTDKGPPLIHDIYNPGHHGDEAFQMAARRGVRQHHWPFGDMPPQTQVKPAEVDLIVRYIREIQVANGITYRPHRM